jgi:hypothetical protein
MPDLGVTFPYGLGDVKIDDAALCELLAFRLMVFAGTADIDTAGPIWTLPVSTFRATSRRCGKGLLATRGRTLIWPRPETRLDRGASRATG